MTAHDEPLLLGASPEEALLHCIFIHGRTQTPEDMQEQVISKLKAKGVSFVMPRARGNSWYAARAVDPLTGETRRQLEHSVSHIRDLVNAIANGGTYQKALVIGGFSQGACLALEYAMRHGPWQGAMVNFTGCRVGTPACDRPFADLDRMPVYLTGSDRDPWIPADATASAAEALARARARLRVDILPDRGHEVSDQELATFDSMLIDLARQNWW